MPQVPDAANRPALSALAVTSVVLGVCGFIVPVVLSFAGAFCGISALRRIKHSNGQLVGRGMAITGVVASLLTMLLSIALIGSIAYFNRTSQYSGFSTMDLANLRQVNTAFISYATQNGQLPATKRWNNTIRFHSNLPMTSMLSPSNQPGAGRFIAMNRYLNRAKLSSIQNPSQTVLLFEISPGGPMSGDASDLPPTPMHRGGYLIGFADGHVQLVPTSRLNTLQWKP